MLEGREIKEVLLSELYLDNEKFRIDDEFFLKEYLQAYKKVKSKPHTILGKELSILTDFHSNGSYETISKNFVLLDEPDYAYMVRTTDLEQNNFSQGVKYISKQSYDFLDKSKIFGGELLINKIGSPGRSYLMPNLNSPASLGMNLFMARVKQSEYLNEKFLYIYLNTITGSRIISRKVNGTVPLTIDKMAVKSLYVPKFSQGLIVKISDYVDQSDKMNSESKVIYQQAKTLLLETLDFADLAIPQQQVNIKSFSESFGKSGRLDAEYYQEKYTRFENCIKNYSNGFRRLNDICILKDSNFNPKPKEFYNYIELADVGNAGEIQNTANLQGNELPTRARRRVNTNDVIISSIEGSLSSCAIIPEELDGSLCSTGFYVISSDKINAETLLILFKSEPLQNLLKKGCSGTILTAINKDEFLNIPIPIIEEHIQLEIADLIQQSQTLRTQSKQLLEYAKQGVEIAIEQGEEQALDFLNKHGNN